MEHEGHEFLRLLQSTWIGAAPNTQFVSQTNLGDGRAMVTVRFTSPIGDGPRQFLRLRVEQR